MSVAANADDYAQKRLGIYFPASANSLADGEFTGQCVSLVKWFIGEMAGVADPGRARGNAKDYGDALVREGLATVVGTPQRGDIVVWKNDGGGYGHIGIVLNGNRVFEENINVAGVKSKVVAGQTVHASRIGSLAESWRKQPATYYRLNSYKEGGEMVQDTDDEFYWVNANMQHVEGKAMTRDYFKANIVGKLYLVIIKQQNSSPDVAAQADLVQWGKNAKTGNWQGQITELTQQLEEAKAATAPALVTPSAPVTQLAPGLYEVGGTGAQS
jgi:hypothetical protein